MIDFIADGFRFRHGVSGGLHFIGDVGVGPQVGRRHLVQREAFGLVRLELAGVAALSGAEVMEVGGGILRRLDGLAQRLDRLAGFAEAFAGLLQPVFQQPGHIIAVVGFKGFAGVVGDGPVE